MWKVRLMTDVMIMAAGLGTRMKSSQAKVLHRLGGRPLIAYSVKTALELHPKNLLVVVGYQAADVEKAVKEEFNAQKGVSTPHLIFVLQKEQRGTGHAVLSAKEDLAETTGPLVVIAGDGPMLKSATLARLAQTHIRDGNAATFLSVLMDDPTGYGRIVRDAGGQFDGQ